MPLACATRSGLSAGAMALAGARGGVGNVDRHRLALPQLAVIARMTRAAMIETLRADHIRTLHAQGLSGVTVALHALRAAALPIISHLGPTAAALLTGSVVVETIFGIPGVGRYFVDGALNRDYTLVMGTVVVVALFVLVFNLAVDLLHALLDPRIRLG